MDTTPNQHLEMPELAKLLEELRARADSKIKATDVHPHLAACADCREQFEGLAELDSQLKTMRVSAPAPLASGCPSPAVWDEVAAGLTDPKQTLAHLEHASRCDHCGPRLRASVRQVASLNQKLTEVERKEIADLQSASPDWQVKLAERISGTPRTTAPSVPWRMRWLSVPILATTAAALAIIAGIAWWTAAGRATPGSANQLLARAYTDQRTLELRIPGAAYAPMRVQKGPAQSFVARPPSLLKAEALIASQLTSHPEDPAWLQAAARANLLEGKYDAAVESLHRALELRPDSPDLLLDLGTAHFQRAQSADRPEDYGAAFEYLSKALAQQPENPTALFNRAIVSEHQFLYRQALEDWEHYLKLDPASQWSEEARNHADAVREKLKEHGGIARPLLAPAQVVPAVMDSEVDKRVEEYLAEAVRKWLPEAFPESGTREADPSAQRALFLLADLTARQHDDRWLSDLLAGSSAPQFPRAVRALARSAAANDTGDYGVSAEQATRAEQFFRASGNRAGTLRAQFEQVFAEQMTRQGEKCRQHAPAALAESKQHLYPWLQIQFGLEQGVCAAMAGDFGTYKSTAQASDIANNARYDAAYLRSVGFLADREFASGNFPQAWKLTTQGMKRYWSGQFVALRGYSLYNVLGSHVDARNEPELKIAVWREAVSLVDNDADLAMRAGAHNALANAADSAHLPQMARDNYAEAARLFAMAPRTGASLVALLGNEIRGAQLEAREGQLDAAVEQLTRNQSMIRQLSDDYLGQIFYSALGEVQLHSNQPSDAEQSLRLALALAEKKLASLKSVRERIVWSKDAEPLYLAMSEAKLVQGRTQESLAVYEWYLGAAQRVDELTWRDPLKGEPDPAWLTSRLPLLSGKTVIAYGVLPDGLAIWTYDNRGVNAQWLPGASRDLREMAQRFYDSCSDPTSTLTAVRRDAHSLYESLVAPIESRLQPERMLVIEANGWTAHVPFEALMDSSGHALIERWPIVYSLGQYSDAQMRSDGAISPAQHALVVASTASSQARDLIPLPNVEAEAQMVASNFPSVEVLSAKDATRQAVSDKLPSAAIFHFTGHSLSAAQHAGLLLAGSDDSKSTPHLLEADDFRRIELHNLQLAVLSTCSTGSGSDESRGFESVTEALERSGVPHVVASRWAVDSTETRNLMGIFYRHLLSGQTVSNALRSTAQQLLSDPRTAHPYFWAAFAAYGQP